MSGIRATHLDETLAARWRECGAWSDELLGDLLPSATAAPSDVAIVEGSRRLTYGELDRLSNVAASRLLADGVRPGDVVAMQLPNWWEAVVVTFAAFRIGAILNPLLPALRVNELGFIFEQARPSAVIVPARLRDEDHVASVRALPAAPPLVYGLRDPGDDVLLGGDPAPLPPATWSADDPCLLLYTSGTSAAPKGALHTHNTLMAEVTGLAGAHAMTSSDVILLPMPVTHVGGVIYAILMPGLLGLRCVLLDSWNAARAIELLEEERVTVQIGMPVYLRGMLDHPTFRSERAASLRLFSMGGTRVTPSDVSEAARVLDCWCKRSYGLTEVPTLTTGPPDDVTHRETTDGRPVGASVVRVVDEHGNDQPPGTDGEIICQAPEMFVGYLDESLNDGAYMADGWFRTGDVGVLDTDGFLAVTGRLKDIIIRGGENISPKEIEDLLVEHEAIDEVAIVAMPDPVYGEKACAFVQSTKVLHLADIVAFLRARGVASYKLPERLELRVELPRNSTGKLRKDVLRREIASILEDDGAEPAAEHAS